MFHRKSRRVAPSTPSILSEANLRIKTLEAALNKRNAEYDQCYKLCAEFVDEIESLEARLQMTTALLELAAIR